MRSSWPKTRQVIEKLAHTAKWKCGKVKFFAGVAFRTKNGFLQLGHLTLSRPWINNLKSPSILSWPISPHWFSCTSALLEVKFNPFSAKCFMSTQWHAALSFFCPGVSIVILVVVWPILSHLPLMISLLICSWPFFPIMPRLDWPFLFRHCLFIWCSLFV